MPRCRTGLAALCAGVVLSVAGGAALPTAAAADDVMPAAASAVPAAPSKPVARAGGAITKQYIVKAAPSGRTVRVDAAATSVRVPKLPNGVAATFTVTAVNVAGVRTASERSDKVVPRKVARFAITRLPGRRVVFGSTSTVGARLVTPAGVGVTGQRVDLLAKVRPSDRWRRVTTATTRDGGRVTLRAVLPATSRLRLHHPIGAVVADDRDVRTVIVAKRVTVNTGPRPTRIGMPVVIRGRVAPAHKVGSAVRLERLVSGSWQRIARGRMTTRQKYAVRWKPARIGRYVLRVTKAGDALRAAGVSKRWAHRVNPESTMDVARDILRDDDITLATVHVSSSSSRATAYENIVDVSNGRLARRSCHGGAPCGSTSLDLRMLRAVREMGRRGTLTVSELAGGVHAGRSAHYSGRGLDITWVNGRHVGYGSSYGMAVDVCRSFGAAAIFTPSNDPHGGHSTHVHCGWE